MPTNIKQFCKAAWQLGWLCLIAPTFLLLIAMINIGFGSDAKEVYDRLTKF